MTASDEFLALRTSGACALSVQAGCRRHRSSLGQVAQPERPARGLESRSMGVTAGVDRCRATSSRKIACAETCRAAHHALNADLVEAVVPDAQGHSDVEADRAGRPVNMRVSTC